MNSTCSLLLTNLHKLQNSWKFISVLHFANMALRTSQNAWQTFVHQPVHAHPYVCMHFADADSSGLLISLPDHNPSPTFFHFWTLPPPRKKQWGRREKSHRFCLSNVQCPPWANHAAGGGRILWATARGIGSFSICKKIPMPLEIFLILCSQILLSRFLLLPQCKQNLKVYSEAAKPYPLCLWEHVF